MDIESLKTVITLASTKSFTRTANQMFVAQSTVTNRINELEKELKLKLFNRTNKTVELTPDGERFRLYAEQVLELTQTSLAEIAIQSFRGPYYSTPDLGLLNLNWLIIKRVVEIPSASYFRVEDGDEVTQKQFGMERCHFKVGNLVYVAHPYVSLPERLE